MKRISDYLSRLKKTAEKEENTKKKRIIDEKTIFFLAGKVITSLYGMKGRENIQPVLFRDRKLFFTVSSSLWANELWLERDTIREKINREIGQEEIMEIKMSER
jgi:hypothetical protein